MILWIQKALVNKLVNVAISRLKSLPDGTECRRHELFFPQTNTVRELLFHYPLRAVMYILVDRSLLNQTFGDRLKEEDYIEDDSQVIGTYGSSYVCKYRRKSKLINDFLKNEETAISSEDNKSTYYVREIREERDGKQKPLLLYRIPPQSSTGKIYYSSYPPLFWISIIILKGTCTGIDSDMLSCTDVDESPGIKYKENESTLFRYQGSDTGTDWFELRNETNKELLVLVQPGPEYIEDRLDS